MPHRMNFNVILCEIMIWIRLHDFRYFKFTFFMLFVQFTIHFKLCLTQLFTPCVLLSISAAIIYVKFLNCLTKAFDWFACIICQNIQNNCRKNEYREIMEIEYFWHHHFIYQVNSCLVARTVFVSESSGIDSLNNFKNSCR